MLGFPPQSSNLNVMASFILACSSSNFDGLREKFPLACLCLNSQPVSNCEGEAGKNAADCNFQNVSRWTCQ